MPVFEYQAINPQGKQVKGMIDAESVRVARQKLRAQSIFPTEIKEGHEVAKDKSGDVKRLFQADRVSIKTLSIATRQLATLVTAGLPLVSALNALADQSDDPVLKRIVIDIREKVEEGSTLARSLGAFPKSFPKLYINMVASGEASGTLDTVLENLADYLEAQVALRRKVISSLVYPVLMLIVCTLVVIALLVFVIPPIVTIFQKQGAALPLPTRIVMGASSIIINYWMIAIPAVVACIYYLRWLYGQEKGRAFVDHLILRMPIYGPIFVKVASARVARTLGALLGSGVGLLQAIDITKNILTNVHLIRTLEEAKDGVREGKSLAKEIAKTGYFPSMLSHMIAVGEKSGELESMLVKAGKSYESEVNAILAGLTSLIEPLMLIVVGCIVMLIVISVFLPMVNLTNVLSGSPG